MPIRNTPIRWGVVARFFHWVGALAILWLLIDGYYMTHFTPRPERFAKYSTHAAIGYIIIAFTLARLLWRQANTTPELAEGTARWEKLAARAGHWGLYLLVFAAAFTGWALAGTMRRPVLSFFGLFDVPALVANRQFHDLLEDTHRVLAWTLAALVVVHVASALWHRFWRKDDVMQRML